MTQDNIFVGDRLLLGEGVTLNGWRLEKGREILVTQIPNKDSIIGRVRLLKTRPGNQQSYDKDTITLPLSFISDTRPSIGPGDFVRLYAPEIRTGPDKYEASLWIAANGKEVCDIDGNRIYTETTPYLFPVDLPMVLHGWKLRNKAEYGELGRPNLKVGSIVTYTGWNTSPFVNVEYNHNIYTVNALTLALFQDYHPKEVSVLEWAAVRDGVFYDMVDIETGKVVGTISLKDEHWIDELGNSYETMSAAKIGIQQRNPWRL